MNKQIIKKQFSVFANLRVLVFAAMLVALSAVFKLLSINLTEWFRIGFEHLPIVLAGVLFGPWVGMLVGVCGDLLGCLIRGFSPIPQITVVVALLGLLAGLVGHLRYKPYRLVITDFTCHIVCSMLLKTLILYYTYHDKTLSVYFATRIPIYIATATAESIILILLLQPRIIQLLRKMTKTEI